MRQIMFKLKQMDQRKHVWKTGIDALGEKIKTNVRRQDLRNSTTGIAMNPARKVTMVKGNTAMSGVLSAGRKVGRETIA